MLQSVIVPTVKALPQGGIMLLFQYDLYLPDQTESPCMPGGLTCSLKSFPGSILLFFARPNSRDFWQFQGRGKKNVWRISFCCYFSLTESHLTLALRETQIFAHFKKRILEFPTSISARWFSMFIFLLLKFAVVMGFGSEKL